MRLHPRTLPFLLVLGGVTLAAPVSALAGIQRVAGVRFVAELTVSEGQRATLEIIVDPALVIVMKQRVELRHGGVVTIEAVVAQGQDFFAFQGLGLDIAGCALGGSPPSFRCHHWRYDAGGVRFQVEEVVLGVASVLGP